MRRLLSLAAAILLALYFTEARAAPLTSPPTAVLAPGTVPTISVSSTSSRATLPGSIAAYGAVTLYNSGTKDAYCALGGAAVTATTSSTPVRAGTSPGFAVGTSDHVACITGGSDATTITVYQANGPLTMNLLGGTGGGGGSSYSPNIPIVADTNLAAGTGVSINASGHAVQGFMAAPVFSSLTTLFQANGNPWSLLRLSADNWVGFLGLNTSYSGAPTTGIAGAVPFSFSGDAPDLGTFLQDDLFNTVPIAGLPSKPSPWDSTGLFAAGVAAFDDSSFVMLYRDDTGQAICQLGIVDRSMVSGGTISLGSADLVDINLESSSVVALTQYDFVTAWSYHHNTDLRLELLAASRTGKVGNNSLGVGGAGYASGDTGVINGNVQDATYVVDAVDGSGAVLTYHLTSTGTQYTVGNGQGTAVSTGGGDGSFTINITSLTDANNSTALGTSSIVVSGLQAGGITVSRVDATHVLAIWANSTAGLDAQVFEVTQPNYGGLTPIGSPATLSTLQLAGSHPLGTRWPTQSMLDSNHFVISIAMGSVVFPQIAAGHIDGSYNVTWGSPVAISENGLTPQFPTGTLPGSAARIPFVGVLDATHVAVARNDGFANGQVFTLSGDTTLTSGTIIKPEPERSYFNVFATGGSSPSLLNTPGASNVVVYNSSHFSITDNLTTIYEFDASGKVSTGFPHFGLGNYQIAPRSSAEGLAIFDDLTTGTTQVRLIKWNDIASPPIGCTASAVTSGQTAQVIPFGKCGGFSGLTPGAQYFWNGDGTVTTANTGHSAGVANDNADLILKTGN